MTEAEIADHNQLLTVYRLKYKNNYTTYMDSARRMSGTAIVEGGTLPLRDFVRQSISQLYKDNPSVVDDYVKFHYQYLESDGFDLDAMIKPENPPFTFAAPVSTSNKAV